MEISQELKTKLVKGVFVFLMSASVLMIAKFLVEIKTYPTVGRDIAPQAVISVSGEGEAFAVPDIAQFTVTVTEEAKTVSEAQKNATDKMNKVIALVKEAGVDDKDIKTESYSVYPRYEYVSKPRPLGTTGISVVDGNSRVLAGQVVSQSILVKVRDTTKAGDILTGVGTLEVDTVSGLNLTVDDQDAVRAEARAEAIADAQAKAKVLSRDLGVRLVRVISFNENGSGLPAQYFAKEAFGLDTAQSANSPEIPLGENKVVSNVTITYEIR